ncbi:RCC1 domain-containing protein [Spirillospora sp. CA-253888]
MTRARGTVVLLAASTLAAAACQGGSPSRAAPAPAPSPAAAGSVGGAGAVWTSGYNSNGQLGRTSDDDMDVSLAAVAGPGGRGTLRGAVAVAGGGRHSLAVLAGGRVVAWGANDHGQLGDGTVRDSRVPVPVRAPDGAPGELAGVVAIGANSDFSMALLGDGKVVTWGEGKAGQRGIGKKAAPRTPTTVLAPDGRKPLTGVQAIAVDGRTELALRKNGEVLAWGANTYGMVGDGTTKNRPLPVPVRGLDGAPKLTGVSRLSIGGQHGMALLRDGRVASWGRNELGQLGSGDRTGRLTPGLVTGPGGKGALDGVVAISSAEKHNYALRRDGTLVSWGNNTAGQLGDGTLAVRTSPVPVKGAHGSVLRGVTQVYAGEAYGVAILSDGTPVSWGAGGKGQLGSGNRVPRSRPGTLVMAHGDTPGNALMAGVGERHLILLLRP